MKRVAAILAAAVMIIVALVVRAALDDDSGGGGGGDSGSDLRITCVTELEDVCAQLENVGVTIADAAATVTALGAGTAEIDAWLTFEPWPEIANVSASRAVVEDSTAVASTRLALVIWNDRAEELGKEACRPDITWRCLGDSGGKPWADLGSSLQGDVEIGLPLPSTATGLLVLGTAAAGFFGVTDYGSNDFDLNPDFAPWLGGLRSGADERDPLNAMLTFGPSTFSRSATTDALTKTALGAREDEVRVLYPAPVATVRVVLAPRGSASVKAVERLATSGQLRDAMRSAGFDVPAADRRPAPGRRCARRSAEALGRQPKMGHETLGLRRGGAAGRVRPVPRATSRRLGDHDDGAFDDVPDGCIVVDLALSPEKIDLMTELAAPVQRLRRAEVDGECVFARPASASRPGAATAPCINGWDEDVDGPEAGRVVAGRQHVGRRSSTSASPTKGERADRHARPSRSC